MCRVPDYFGGGVCVCVRTSGEAESTLPREGDPTSNCMVSLRRVVFFLVVVSEWEFGVLANLLIQSDSTVP